ncbi:ParB N-terminal domain-containing protein [Roseobacter sp. YSTF-M11]|uniref:ParB N-terminal domain-containing protein n=1 Tax=Roseobacter insulae TaxID=2859783 RepID=A0A9X1K4N0_9RHOB|nr:ParB N-terminal domain-containing protein [Roseobacter insulae]MBW4710773.1 ParB N-terminal domain-containing protein [Roseobacter insulae]
MAKRKRLTPPFAASGPDTGSNIAYSETAGGISPGLPPKPRAPIAQVAGDAAAQSALEVLASEMHAARSEGRLVQSLPLEAISEDHMVRDRMGHDPTEMDSLKSSLSARGQQTPIEVVALEPGRFGLISGWRRLHALRALHEDTGEARYATIEALIKPVESVSDGYVAMVEENEIRANLSFYERAHLACAAARLGVFPTPARAVQKLFANATSVKRSKINSFVRLHEALGATLRFPEAIPEKLGLALVAALEGQAGFAARLTSALRKARPETAAAERATLEQALRALNPVSPAPRQEAAPGVFVEQRKGALVLSGKGVDDDLRRDLQAWLSARQVSHAK